MEQRLNQSTLLTRLLSIPSLLCLGSIALFGGYVSKSNAKPSPKMLIARSEQNPNSVASSDVDTDRGGDPFDQYQITLALLKSDYFRPIDAKEARKLTYAAIRGMLASLKDPFTSFLDPDEWSQFHTMTTGDFEGIGAYLQPDGLYAKVVRPIEGGPAEKVGVRAGDLVIGVDSMNVKGKDLNDVIHHIKGKRGTKVLIKILRGKQHLSFLITRATVEPQIGRAHV